VGAVHLAFDLAHASIQPAARLLALGRSGVDALDALHQLVERPMHRPLGLAAVLALDLARCVHRAGPRSP